LAVSNLKIDTVVTGDCLKILSKYPDGYFDACITDPPYNISGHDGKKSIGWLKSNPTWELEKKFNKIDAEWDKFSEADYRSFTINWIKEITRVVKPNGNILIFGSYHNIYRIGATLEDLDLRIVNSIIWYKRNAFPNVTQRMFCESTEQVIWAVNNTRKKAKNWTFNYHVMSGLTENGKQMRNMWDIPMTSPSEKSYGKHPSQKPLKVADRLVLGCTNSGDKILDPFSGSGSFAVSAKSNGRHFLGIDVDSEYVRLAKKRLGQIKLK
jgi:site-specific DNA-methyltransferase (adenine-specific)